MSSALYEPYQLDSIDEWTLSEAITANRLSGGLQAVLGTVLEMKNGDFKWSNQVLEPTLQHLDMTVRKGELVGILGPVGSGKVCLAV